MSRVGENITKRKDGRWEARYIKGYKNGEAVYGYLYGKTYEEAKKKKNKAIEQLSCEVCSNESITFNHIVDSFLSQKKYQVKESTYSHYVWLINSHIRKQFSSISVDEIDSLLIEKFISAELNSGRINKEGGMSPKSVKDTLCLLKSIIKYGVEKGLIADGTLPAVRSPKVSRGQIDIFSTEECEKIESKAIVSSEMYYGIYFCLYTGLRIGELCALRWSDIDVLNECIYINRTISRINNTNESGSKTKIIIDSPKSESSIRVIPLPAKIVSHLSQRYPENNETYFLTRTNRYIEPRNYYEKYKKFLLSCGIEKHTFHALRHSFAIHCIEKGFDAKVLSEILGHSDVKITLDRYVHPSLDRKRQCMQLL